MEPKVLADALVEAGILTPNNDGEETLYYPGCYDLRYEKQREMCITDWRVAGKVLESIESYDGFTLDQSGDDAGCNLIRIFDRSGVTLGKGTGRFPRAIIEAWYEANEND